MIIKNNLIVDPIGLEKRSSAMSDSPEDNPKEKKDEKKSEDNTIESCAGGLSADQAKQLQEELEQAKESNSFSSTSRCVIV